MRRKEVPDREPTGICDRCGAHTRVLHDPICQINLCLPCWNIHWEQSTDQHGRQTTIHHNKDKPL